MQANAWIVVADSSRARILKSAPANGQMEVVASLVHPESRLKDTELISDRPGRVHGGPAGPKSGADSGSESAHDREADRFSREVVQELQKGSDRHDFDSLVLVAPPRFLGRLRSHLGPLESAVTETLALDLTQVRDLDLPDAIARGR